MLAKVTAHHDSERLHAEDDGKRGPCRLNNPHQLLMDPQVSGFVPPARAALVDSYATSSGGQRLRAARRTTTGEKQVRGPDPDAIDSHYPVFELGNGSVLKDVSITLTKVIADRQFPALDLPKAYRKL